MSDRIEEIQARHDDVEINFNLRGEVSAQCHKDRGELLKLLTAQTARAEWDSQTIALLRYTIKNMKDRPFISVHKAVKNKLAAETARADELQVELDNLRMESTMKAVHDRNKLSDGWLEEQTP